jgi:hypothetical protein
MSEPSKQDINDALGSSNADWTKDDEWETSSGQSASWDFRKDKTIRGVYVGKHNASSKFGERELYTLEDKDGNKTDVWQTAVLKREFDNTPIGTEVRIQYQGKQQTDKGQQVNTFLFQRRKALKVVTDENLPF